MTLIKFIKKIVNTDTILQDSLVMYLLITTFLKTFIEE